MAPGVKEAETELVSKEGDQKSAFHAVGGESMKIDYAIIHILAVINKMKADLIGYFFLSDSEGGGDVLVFEGEMGVESGVVDWVGEGVLSSELKL